MMGWSSTISFQEEITMENKMAWPLVIILFGVVGISLLIYAGAHAAKVPVSVGMPADEAPVDAGVPGAEVPVKNIHEMLMEAGFKVYHAETSQEMAYLKSFPKGRLMIHQQIGRVVYCFVEPASNTLYSNVLYMGNSSAYRNFQDLLEKRKQEIKEQRIESDREFWNTWGHRYFAY
jgi:hypothetical protein